MANEFKPGFTPNDNLQLMHEFRSSQPLESQNFARIRALFAMVGVAILLIQSGCISWDISSARRLAYVASFGKEAPVSVRKRPKNPLETTLNLVGKGGPKPSARTEQVLRRYALLDEYSRKPDRAVNQLMEYVQRDPSLEMIHAWTELAYIRGHSANMAGDFDSALSWYCGAVTQAFSYLFDDRMANYRNAYDPVFRSTCDIYNQSLEGILRIVHKKQLLKPDAVVQVNVANHNLDFRIKLTGRWHTEQIEEIKFVSDLSVHGLRNQYETFGLGVPLVAMRADISETELIRTDAEYYPPDLTFPLTAFFEVIQPTHPSNPTTETLSDVYPLKPTSQFGGDLQRTQYVLHLFDPLETKSVAINGQIVPLQSDITTPLAYFLKDPLINTNVFSTLALIDGEFAKHFRGLYMLEPYDPNKIPVLMVHGLWSSPITWTEMFNDLRADPELSSKYQFWFYLYPSGQPFWETAYQMRQDLTEARHRLDPYREAAALDHMVLIGHSMGGLVSRLQTLESRDDFWNIVSDRPFDELGGDPESLAELEGILFFSPNPSIRRVVTLGTPHRGSDYANNTARWFSRQVFRLPSKLVQRTHAIVRANPNMFHDSTLFEITTSVDSLSPDSPFFEKMADAERAPWVLYHNVVGRYERRGVSKLIDANGDRESDGVVAMDSARSHDTISEIVVPAEHSILHQHPESILEVRRILLENLAEFQRESATALDAMRNAELPVPRR